MLSMLRYVVLFVLCSFFTNTTYAKSDYNHIQKFKITAHDSIKLNAQLWEPNLLEFPGKRPAVIFINSWGLNKNQYDGAARHLVKKGYVVLAYATRGFGGSEGMVSVASDNDIADLSTAIDWIIDNTRADEANIASAGISYGAGISLITSAKDPRIKAVIAMSSWADLEYSLYPNETLNKVWVDFLVAFGKVLGNLDPEVLEIYEDAKKRVNIEKLRAWSRKRSAGTYIDEINENGPAIFLSHNYKDQMFPINQTIHFYDKLTTPKKLVTQKGIHASAELKGMFGLDSTVWNPVYEWLDHYLTDKENNVNEGSIQFKSTNSKNVNYIEEYKTRELTEIELTPMRHNKSKTSTGMIINSSRDSRAETGIPIVSAVFESYLNKRVKHDFRTTRKEHGAMYSSEVLDEDTDINGIPEIQMFFDSYFSDVQVVAYLYDIPPRGRASLVSHGVSSYHELHGELTKVNFELFATSYKIKRGHRIGLIIDTGDALYQRPSDEVFSYSIKEDGEYKTKILLPL